MREVVRRNRVARRPRLSAGHARRRAARPRLPAGRSRRRSSSPRARSIARQRRQAGGGGRRGDHRARQPLGRASTSRRSASCRTCSPSRRRGRPAPSRPGSSTATASSPKAPRPMPGSSPATERSSRARPSTASSAASPGASSSTSPGREGLTVEERPFTVAEAQAAREAFITAASDHRHAGRPDRRRRRSATGKPGPARDAAPRALSTQAEIALRHGPCIAPASRRKPRTVRKLQGDGTAQHAAN